MAQLFLLAAAVGFLSVSGIAAPASPPTERPWSEVAELRNHPIVKAIDVKGLETLSTSTVTRALQTQVGKPFDLEAFRRDQDALAALGYFNVLEQKADYELVPGGVRLIITVRENPRLRKITFIGNVKFNDAQLLAEFPEKEGEILHTRSEDRIRRALKGFYGEGGYHQVSIKARRVPVSQREVDVVVYINEGKSLQIQKLILKGNDSYPAIWIVPRLINHGSWLFFSNNYDDEAFQTDLETVRTFYIDRGFLDVKVRAGAPVPGDEKDEICPVIEIVEGRRYTVSEVAIRGNTLFTDQEVHEPFERLIGSCYDGDSLRASIEKLRDLYGNEGYIDLEVKVKTVTDAETAAVRLDVILQEGEVVYVGQPRVQMRKYEPDENPHWYDKIFLWMSPPTKDSTVLKELRLKSGQKYRRYDEVRTIERLKNLRIFEKVDIQREATEDPQVRNPVVEVEESGNAGHVGAAVGYGDITGPAVTLSYINPNIAGEAKVLSASATFGQHTQRYQTKYLNRHWEDTDNSLELNAYLFNDALEGYRQRIIGASTEVGHPLSEYLTAYLRLRLEDVKFSHRKHPRKERLDPYYAAAIRGMLEWDHRDNIIWPTKGFRVSGGVESGYADGALLKFLHSFGYYKTITGDLVWAYEHDLGLAPYHYNRVGITERFFMGGSNDLRGFKYRGASPTDPIAHHMRVGGSTKFVQRNELRFPIAGPLKGRVFVDDGMNEKNPLNFRRPRASTGVGFVVDLKAVNVEVDFARALIYEHSDSRRLLHFRISSGF